MNTSWGKVYGQEMLNIAPDVLPGKRIEGRTLPVNSYLSWRAAIAHEVVGHRAAYMAGRTQENDMLEEVQASLRAAVLAEGLTQTDRRMLMRDARARLRQAGLKLKDTNLWLK